MPPKASQPETLSSLWKPDLSTQRKARAVPPNPSSSRPTTPTGGDGFDKRKVLGTAGMAIDALKKVSELSDFLGPLGMVCDALKFAVDTAEAVFKNEDDIKDLLDKLRRQLSFMQEKSGPLTDTRFRPSRSSIQGLVKSLEAYTLNLDEVQNKLQKLQRTNERGIKRIWNKAISADEDKGEIENCTRQLDESFRMFMASVTFFIADQTAFIADQTAEMLALQSHLREQNEELLALQTFNQLQYVQGSQGNQHSRCLKGTRQAILEEISQWVASIDAKPVYALIDRAGTGKSTISRHMVHEWKEEQRLTPRFFFSKPKGITSSDNLAATLAKDMSTKIPFLRSIIVKALSDHPMLSGDTIERNLELLIFIPLKELRKENDTGLILVREEQKRGSFIDIADMEKWHENVRGKAVIDNLKKAYVDVLRRERESMEEEYMEEVKTVAMVYLRALEASLAALPIIVLDALDECSKDQTKVLKSFLQYISTFQVHEAPFKLFFTSRPEKDVMSLLYKPSYIQRAQLSLHSKDFPSNQHDVELYTTSRLHTELNPEQISQFAAKADGLFTWASTAATFILTASDPLSIFANLMASTLEEQPLDTLYDAIVDDACHKVGKNELRRLLEVLQLISVAREPLTINAMDDLLGFTCKPGSSISGAFVIRLGSVISDGSDGKPVQALHPTFIEYLLRSQSTPRFAILKSNAHLFIAERCLAILLSKILHHDICDVIMPDAKTPRNNEIEDIQRRLDHKVPPGLRYAAEYSMRHITDCLRRNDTIQELRALFEKKLLCWIELMSYLGEMPALVNSIHVLAAQMKETNDPIIKETHEWCDETLRMIQEFQSSITESALQVYYSALAFAPHRSKISMHHYETFKALIPRVKRGAWALKPRSIQLSGHSNSVNCVSFSPDGHKIASGSRDGTVRLWDGNTGAVIRQPLSAHTLWVTCLAFSPDGRKIVSGSADKTVRLWDADTGVAIGQPLAGHTLWVICLSFSPNGRKIASGSADKTIRLWNADTGVAIGQSLSGHTDSVDCLSFSPDGRKIASGSADETVRLWNAETGAAIDNPLCGHKDWVKCFSFSPNGRVIASGSADKTVRLWDADTGLAIGQPLSGHKDSINCLSFSPNGRKIASGSADRTVRLWDADAGVAIGQPLSGHTGWINCLSFSPDSRKIASGSADETVRLWDADTGEAIGQPLSGHKNSVGCLSFSPDGRKIVSGSTDRTARLWVADTGTTIGQSRTGHADSVKCLSFSSDGRKIASGSADRTVRLWDADTGAAIGEPLSGHTDSVNCLSFSPDGRKIASGSADKTVRMWDADTGVAIGQPLSGHTDRVNRLSFSPDGCKVVSGSVDRTLRLWDADTGALNGHPLNISYHIESLELFQVDANLFLNINNSSLHQNFTYPTTLISSTDLLSTFSKPGYPVTSPSRHSISFENPWTIIRSKSYLRFHLPSHFHFTEWRTHEGKVAYGGRDGSIIIVDCTHLL